MNRYKQLSFALLVSTGFFLTQCKPKDAATAISGNAAEKTYVAPGRMYL